MLNKPLVYGAILRFEGQASVFNYRGGPNYRDLLPEPPPPGETCLLICTALKDCLVLTTSGGRRRRAFVRGGR
eukprot:41146-Eustigmatos_ZCMA.PRE.1